MTDRELMQQALEALERCVATCFHAYAHEQVMSRPEHFVNQNIAALRERLAQPEQKPVAWLAANGTLLNAVSNPELYTPLYTTPPRREWVGLTDEDMVMCESEEDVRFVRVIEAKLKEKNT